RLYTHFFKSYTEKVWGVPATEVRSEWAAQRIKGLSFFSAAKAAFFGNKGNKIKSLIDKFQYPRYGPGQMWETMTARIEELGGEVRLETPATRLEFVDDECVAVHTPDEIIEPEAVISSLPLRATAGITDPAPPERVTEAAKGLRYRDFLTVALVLDGEDLFPDNWIYIHEPDVHVGRIQNYRSWSPWMVPDPDTACVGLEYFAFKGHARARAARPGPARAGPPRLRGARPARLPDVRRGLRRARGHHPRVAGPAGDELPAGR